MSSFGFPLLDWVWARRAGVYFVPTYIILRTTDCGGNDQNGRMPQPQSVAQNQGLTVQIAPHQMVLTIEDVEREALIVIDETPEYIEAGLRLERRLQAVREACWSNASAGELECLHSVLAEAVGIDFSRDQFKAVFMMLPPEIISAAVKFEFADPLLCEFSRKWAAANRESLRDVARSASLEELRQIPRG